jgi:hypothetical protein
MDGHRMGKGCAMVNVERHHNHFFWCNILSILEPERGRAIAFVVREYWEHAVAQLGIVAQSV